MFYTNPLLNASLGVNAILILATLVQIGIAVSYAFRGQSPHVAPGVAAIFAFLVLFVAYGLDVPNLLVLFITDSFGVPLVSYQVIINIETATTLLFGLADPALFLAVAFVIRDRYLAYHGKGPNGGKHGLPLLPFMIISYFLALTMVGLASASIGVFHAAALSNLTIDAFIAKLDLSNQLLYASVAIYMVATILLIPFASVVRQNAKSDRINNMTLFGIIPLLCLRAVARMILVIIRARNQTFGSINEDAFNLAEVILMGVPYLAATSILSYFFLSVQLWIEPANSTPQMYFGYPGSQQPFQGGLQPVAQFPGQWGFFGVQPQQGYVPPNISYLNYPLPQGGGYYPNQLPGQQHAQQYVQEPFQPSAVVPPPGPGETH